MKITLLPNVYKIRPQNLTLSVTRLIEKKRRRSFSPTLSNLASVSSGLVQQPSPCPLDSGLGYIHSTAGSETLEKCPLTFIHHFHPLAGALGGQGKLQCHFLAVFHFVQKVAVMLPLNTPEQ